MKILVMGHTYIVKVNQRKLYELAKIPGVKLCLVIPQIWYDPLFKSKLKAEINENVPFTIHPLETVFGGIEGRYFYRGLGKLLKGIKPDIIQVEQGANALSYFQTLIFKNLHAPQAKALFFTWVNTPYENGPFFTQIEKFNLKNSDAAICGNAGAEKILRDKGFAKPIKVIPQLGVDTELFKKMEVTDLKKNLSLRNFVIGYVGRLVKRKGLLTLIQALGEIKGDWQLLLVGRGELKNEIVRLSEDLNLREKIVFVDSVHHSEVPKYISCMDVLVLPSLKEQCEQFGHILIEAMACEVPVIGSTSGEIPNVVGDAGLTFKEGDVNDLREKILLLMNNERLRRELAQKGRQRVLEKYTNKKIAEETCKFYEQVLSK